jgi:long-subunit fatty acid transport protein
MALTPNDALNVSVTYRSNVDLELEGDVTMGAGGYTMSTGGDVTNVLQFSNRTRLNQTVFCAL